MKRSAALIVMAILGLSSVAGCQFLGGDTVLGEDEWTAARQQQIDLVTTVAHETSAGAYAVVESIGFCESGDDLDDSIGASNYLITAVPNADAREQLDQLVRPRLDADGWTFRDSTSEPHAPDGTVLDYGWTKAGAQLTVTITPGRGDQSALQVNAVSTCGKLGDITHGDVQPDDPWFLAPTVDGPTYADNRRSD